MPSRNLLIVAYCNKQYNEKRLLLTFSSLITKLQAYPNQLTFYWHLVSASTFLPEILQRGLTLKWLLWCQLVAEKQSCLK